MGDVLGRRIAAALIDAAIIAILLVLIAKGLGDEGTTKRSLWAETEGGPRTLFLLLTFAYFFGTEIMSGQTLGKRVMKIRVVGEDGAKLGAGAAAIRNLVRFIDALPVLYIVGAISVFATGQRRARLGDLAAKTKVVADDAPPPPPSERRDRPEDDDILAQVLR
ncbi:MAG: RDD family protein [Actinomycetota bacterium]|nr:RDD family protein [Actinomycetota bacterium]